MGAAAGAFGDSEVHLSPSVFAKQIEIFDSQFDPRPDEGGSDALDMDHRGGPEPGTTASEAFARGDPGAKGGGGPHRLQRVSPAASAAAAGFPTRIGGAFANTCWWGVRVRV